jgi:hypothetical protein
MVRKRLLVLEQYSCLITKAFDCAGVKKLVKEGRIGEVPEVAQFPTNQICR